MRNTFALISARCAALSRGRIGTVAKPAMFAVLLWAASAAGSIPIPGTPVPITLQTFVVMLAGLMLTWRQAGAAITMYLAAGAIGLPVFAGGASTLALVGPSAGFLIGFLPAAMLTAALKGRADTSTPLRAVVTVSLYLLAAFTGCVVLDYALGFIVQSALTGLSIKVVAIASMGFIIGDIIKVCVASLAAAGLTRLDR